MTWIGRLGLATGLAFTLLGCGGQTATDSDGGPGPTPAPNTLAVHLGQGEANYAAVRDGDELEIVRGLQGALMVVLAARVDHPELAEDSLRAEFTVTGDRGRLAWAATESPVPDTDAMEMTGVYVIFESDGPHLMGAQAVAKVEVTGSSGKVAVDERRVVLRLAEGAL
jgi:hypothetical protein